MEMLFTELKKCPVATQADAMECDAVAVLNDREHEMTPEASANPQETSLQNCLMGKFGGADLVVCREGIMPCKWAMHFGDLLFCNRSSAKLKTLES